MRVINARNAHEALPEALWILGNEGVARDSRNGKVLVMPTPVTTVYSHPMERVVFWKERDANPFFHLFESLWMLRGRNDLEPLVRYVKNFGQFSDDGKTLHGAYGKRWRDWFPLTGDSPYVPSGKIEVTVDSPRDQLAVIADRLFVNPEDRRCVLQMWDPSEDLGRQGKDVPCNLTVTFQRGAEGELNMVVFNRSNDIVWGAYGANSVHFGFLLEYMAQWIGCEVGTYTQVSVNWHGYLSTITPLAALKSESALLPNFYQQGVVSVIPMRSGIIGLLNRRIDELLMHASTGFQLPRVEMTDDPFIEMCYTMLRAHHVYRTGSGEARYEDAIRVLVSGGPYSADWIVGGIMWLERRQAAWREKNG